MQGFLVWNSSSTTRFLWDYLFTALDLRVSCSSLDSESDSDESSILITIILMSLFLRALEASF